VARICTDALAWWRLQGWAVDKKLTFEQSLDALLRYFK
jgi:hypothetical protein